ncbi:MAG: three-Cys-motif partner protein TcmP [Ignavibacteria bacterium]|nr:three-Cys-motif partner protein TcmP [Ignavibacteria bacterium]
MTNSNSFFNESSEQSQVKSRIIAKYFWVWAKVIIATAKRNKREPKIAYIDLFAGPGRYEDGTKSTPLKVIEKAIGDESLCNSLVTIFNDKEETFIKSLKSELNGLDGINNLRYKPQILNNEVGDSIAAMFEGMKLIPTFFFVDPWGYKGLSLRLVNSVLKDWGCDCVFFFNYNRINMGLSNEKVEEHMNALFGKERGDKIREELGKLNPAKREMLIVEELANALKELGGNFVLPFCFKNENGKRTSHHLFFVSKNFKGYEIMKEIMACESSKREQGVPNFEYNPADLNYPTLFEYNQPLDNLENMLLNAYSGNTITMNKLYLEHSVGRPYISRNYKTVLIKLEKEGRITANPPISNRRKYKGEDTFGPDVEIQFP